MVYVHDTLAFFISLQKYEGISGWTNDTHCHGCHFNFIPIAEYVRENCLLNPPLNLVSAYQDVYQKTPLERSGKWSGRQILHY